MFLIEEILPADHKRSHQGNFQKLSHFHVFVTDYHSDEVDTSRGQNATPSACASCFSHHANSSSNI